MSFFPPDDTKEKPRMLSAAPDLYFDDLLREVDSRLLLSGKAREIARKERRSGPVRVAPNELRRRPRRGRRLHPKRGEALFITNDLDLVLSMRHALMPMHFDLTWTNNFWVAMSFLRTRMFSALYLDMDVESVEEQFVPHFIEEYDEFSGGHKVFLASRSLTKAMRRQIVEQGHVVFDVSQPPEELIRAFAIGK